MFSFGGTPQMGKSLDQPDRVKLVLKGLGFLFGLTRKTGDLLTSHCPCQDDPAQELLQGNKH